MLDLGALKYTVSKKSERDGKITAFLVRKLSELNQYRDAYSKEWKVADDRVWVRTRKAKGEDASHLEGDPSSEWQTHILFPHEFSVIRQSIASMVRNLPVAIFETYDEQNQWKLEVWKHVWHNAIQESGWDTQLTYALIDMRIKGVGFLELGYMEKYKKIRQAVYAKDKDGSAIFSPANIVDTTEKTILEYDGLINRRLDPNNVWIDMNASDIHAPVDGAKIGIIKDVYDIFSFQREFESFKNVKAVRPVGLKSSPIETESEQNPTERENEGDTLADEYVHVYRVYLPDSDECYYVANNEVIYDGPIPYSDKKIPIALLKNLPIPGELYVPGEIAFTQQIAEVMNVILGLAIDNKKMGLQPHTFMEASDDLDPDDIQTRPGGYTPVPKGFDVNRSLQNWAPPDMSGNVTEILSQMEKLLIQVSGVDVQALTPPPSEKVTQTLLKKEISNALLDLTVKFNEMNGLKDAFVQMSQKLMEFYPRKKVRNFLSPDGEYEEEIGYPKVMVRNYKVNEDINEKNPNKTSKISFTPDHGVISLFEAKPEFVRQQLIISVKEGSLQGSLQELALKRWLELLQLILQFSQANPELGAKLDWDKLLGKTFQKYQENPDDMLIKQERPAVEDMSESEREIQALLSGKKYLADGPVDNDQHEKAIRDHVSQGKTTNMSDLKSLFNSQLAHLNQSIGGEKPPPPEPAMAMQGDVQVMGRQRQGPDNAEGLARSLGNKTAKTLSQL